MRARHFFPITIVAGLAALALAAPALAAPPTVVVDGQTLQADIPAIESDGRVLVPLRAIMQRLGAVIAYDARSQTISAEVANRVIYLTIGSRRAFVNGKPVTLDVPARTFAGRTIVPLRFIGESLGAVVDYDAATDTAVVITGRTPGNFVAAISGARYASAYAARGLPPSVQDERPAPDSVIGSSYPEIYARFSGGSSPIDPASVNVTLDGGDVTADSTISAAYISYTPSRRLNNGEHRVEISGRSDDGTPFDEAWTFRVDAGYSPGYVSSIVDGGMGPYGYPRFGFYPPGFSLFIPGPQFFVGGNIIEIVFYSPFFPYGTCFVSIAGLPGSYACTPWGGYPGYFYSYIPVPYGAIVNNGIVSCHFRSFGGPRVIVHATAPITINGNRTTLPGSMRFLNVATPLRDPVSPYHLVVVKHPTIPGQTWLPQGTLPVYVHLPANGGHSGVGVGQPTTVNSTNPGSSRSVKTMPVNSKPVTSNPPANGSGTSSNSSSSGSHSNGSSSDSHAKGSQDQGNGPKPTPAP